MLETLKIKNIAVIDSAEIPFEAGLNILSGETGAGKSIVIAAISLLLGSRATAELIRTGCDEATVEGLFSLKDLPWMEARLTAAGFETESGELLIRRTVSRAGKHRIYVNGSLATLSALQALCEDLIDLCGQHEHQSLLKASMQMDLLDRFGALGKDAAKFAAEFSAWRSLQKEKSALEGDDTDRARRKDFLSFQIQELRDAGLNAGEDEALQREKSLLQSSESRIALAESAREALEGESGALGAIRIANQKLKALAPIDAEGGNLRESLDRALAELEDASLGLNRYIGSVELDPNRLEEIQTRLSKIAELKRKYGADADEMLARLKGLEDEYSILQSSEERLQEIEMLIAQQAKTLRAAGAKLSEKRKKVAELLSKSVTGELKDLKMADAKFRAELTAIPDLDEWTKLGPDSISFVVQTNKGETARPIGKVASGGELSRIMLAIRRVIADRGGIGVYLFDEIDAGIGGQTAFEVGKKLRSVASHNQVICITHLPQVAAFATHHLSVRKESQGSRTSTTVVELGAKERKEEIARMLGGPKLTKSSLENAAELMGMAK